MIVNPKVSVGDVFLGMSEDDVQTLLGQPDSRREEIDENDDVHIHLDYDEHQISLAFWGDCDFRLGTITIENEEIHLDGKPLIGLSEKAFQENHSGFTLDEEIDDLWHNYEDSDREIDVWVAEGVVSSFSIGPAWQDDETPEWPER